jgi:hypothetical protein
LNFYETGLQCERDTNFDLGRQGLGLLASDLIPPVTGVDPRMLRLLPNLTKRYATVPMMGARETTLHDFEVRKVTETDAIALLIDHFPGNKTLNLMTVAGGHAELKKWITDPASTPATRALVLPPVKSKKRVIA